MPTSSQPQSQESPGLKRKQQSISSFFSKAGPIIKSKTNTTSSVSGPAPVQQSEESQKEDAENNSAKNGSIGAEDDDDDDDIILPANKRLKIRDSAYTGSTPVADKNAGDKKKDHETLAVIDGNATVERKMSGAATAPPLSSGSAAGRTEKYRFGSSQVEEVDDGNIGRGDARKREKEREKLHHRFVKKLGGADCLIGNRPSATEDPLEDDAEAAEDDDEPPPPPPKGKGGKKGAGGAKKLTPMEKQVLEIKRKHKDTVLIVEVGYKFRFFGEDARIAAKVLSIVCIPGKMRYDEHPSEAHLDRFASASIPVHRLHVHVKRLVEAGYKVGVVRQLETAALKAAGDNRNAPFERKLTNLYTKGTYVDDVEGLEGPAESSTARSPASGYLLCMTETNSKGWGSDEKVDVGILAVQPATGDVIYDEFEDGFMRSEVETRLLHIAPCEFLLVGELSKATEKLVQHLSGSRTNVFGDTARVERVTKQKTAAADAHSHVSSFYADRLKATDTENDVTASNLLDKVLNLPENVTICLSAMIKHMTEYGLEHVFALTKYFQSFSARSHMLLNGNTLTSLEIYQNQTDHTTKGSLFWTLDRTRTRFGQRLLRKWVGRPLLDRPKLEERVVAVEELLNQERMTSVERLKGLLSKTRSDLEKSLIRIYYGKCTRPELLTVLQTMQMIGNEFSHVKSPPDAGFDSSLIGESIAALPVILDDIIGFLNRINLQAAKSDDKYNFFRELEETEDITERKLGIAAVEYELDEHRAEVCEVLGRKKMDYATVAGIEYLVEVDNSSYQLKRVPASWAKISGTKKISRFHTPKVVKLLRQRDQHKEALAAACDKAFLGLLADISTKYQLLRDCIQSLATLDCLLSLAAIASQPGYVKPEYSSDTCIDVQEGRHPMVEQMLLDTYVPNDISLSQQQGGTRALLITGPNMGGKSSYVRQVALIAIMGQIGSYVPAKFAKLGLLDAVYTRMGAFDNMMAGESTFMVELSETSDILKQATPRSLVILDELGRGTSTHDGVAIAQAVLDHLVRHHRSLTLFITHYQNLSAMARNFPSHELKNVHMKFTESGADGQEITFLYEVGEGVAHRSYGLNVARLAMVPPSVLETAALKSSELEQKMRQRRLAGLIRAVGDMVSDGNEDNGKRDEASLEQLLAGIEQL